MPSSIKVGSSFPVPPALHDARIRKREPPKDISVQDLEKGSSEEIAKLARAVRLLATDVYDPPEKWFTKGEEHRKLLADAVNYVGAAAFTPRTYQANLTATEVVADLVVHPLAGMSIAVTVPVRCRLQISLQARIVYTAHVAGALLAITPLINGVGFTDARIVWGAPDAVDVGEVLTFSSHGLYDAFATPVAGGFLLPNTLYTITAQAQGFVAAGTWTIEKVGNINENKLVARVEPAPQG